MEAVEEQMGKMIEETLVAKTMKKSIAKIPIKKPSTSSPQKQTGPIKKTPQTPALIISERQEKVVVSYQDPAILTSPTAGVEYQQITSLAHQSPQSSERQLVVHFTPTQAGKRPMEADQSDEEIGHPLKRVRTFENSIFDGDLCESFTFARDMISEKDPPGLRDISNKKICALIAQNSLQNATIIATMQKRFEATMAQAISNLKGVQVENSSLKSELASIKEQSLKGVQVENSALKSELASIKEHGLKMQDDHQEALSAKAVKVKEYKNKARKFKRERDDLKEKLDEQTKELEAKKEQLVEMTRTKIDMENEMSIVKETLQAREVEANELAARLAKLISDEESRKTSIVEEYKKSDDFILYTIPTYVNGMKFARDMILERYPALDMSFLELDEEEEDIKEHGGAEKEGETEEKAAEQRKRC